MLDFHGIVFAYYATPELGELVSKRTAASLPFCGRYRLIDFALSSMMNAGIRDVGVVMQRDYQSLLDHLGSGKAWDMSRKSGGLHLLPPFGLPEYHTGNYAGTMEALNAVKQYVRDIPQKYVVLLLGDMCANFDLRPVLEQHLKSGCPVTAICADHTPEGYHHRYLVGEDGLACDLLCELSGEGDKEGFASLEGYVIEKELLLSMMAESDARNIFSFHRGAMTDYLRRGGKMGIYVHKGYAQVVRTVETYFRANMDMLDAAKRAELFPAGSPVRTKTHEGVSTYYGEEAVSRRSLVGDNCIIEGDVENCVIFSGVRIGKGAKLKNCIVMSGTTIADGAQLTNVIADKDCCIAANTVVTGTERVPVVIGKGKTV